MEATMLTVDRLVDGMHGGDPGGARLYMSQLRENETLSMLECFEDMLSGRLPVAPPSSSGGAVPLSGSSGGSMAYRVPPSEFLQVLVEGDTTRLGALHAVLQAIGRGDLQGRAASLCISEVRMCLFACTDSTGAADGDCRSAPPIHRRMPVAQLRELAGVCLSFSMDTSASSLPTAGVYAGGRRGAENANNRRVLMLEALPAVLGACFAAAAAAAEEDDVDDDDDDENNDSGESDYEHVEDEVPERRGNGGAGRGAVAAAAAAAAGKKPKGKGKSGGTEENGRRRGSNSDSNSNNGCAGRSIRAGSRNWPRSSRGHGGAREGKLPERGEEILWDVTDYILDRPWPLRLALPLLVLFEEIYGLVELLDSQGTRARPPAREDASGRTTGEESVWTRVRSRLMEVVRMGGLDGADFTGVVRQVCVLCDIDGRWDYEHSTRCLSPPVGKGLSECDVEPTEEGEGVEVILEAQKGARAGGNNASGGGSWLLCLRHLYAAVPPEWISTVELVLEQTLHQMPGVAESLLDTIQNASSSRGGSEAGRSGLTGGEIAFSRAKWPRYNSGPPSSLSSSGLGRTPTSISSDLALLILLLREASPLRACSLPLLPVGVDRGRRAEEGIRRLLLEATRSGFKEPGETGGSNTGQTPECRDRECALGGVRALLRAVLCSESSVVGDGGGSGARGYHGRDGGGSSSGGGINGEGGVSSGVVSERASQLLELALQWLEEGDGMNGTGGDNGAIYGKEGGGTGLSSQDIASEIMSAMFDAVVEARPRLLKALLGGVFDRNQSGTACAWSYLRAWEALMAREAELECRRLTPYSQGVSDALGRLTLLPQERGRRVIESMLPLADVCPTQASALMNLCRKCSVQGESKGRLLTVHAVTCILAWNARRAKSGRNGGFLEQEGMQEDLVEMFRRAFEGGLQTAARADALNLLATKLRMPALDVARGTPFNRSLLQVAPFPMPSSSAPRTVVDREPLPVVDLSALNGLREFLWKRLFRFFAHKDEVLDVDSSTAGGNGCDTPAGIGRRSGGGAGGVSRGKGKQRARRRRGGRFLLVPLRLLEEPVVSSTGHRLGEKHSGGRGRGVVGNVRGRGVVARDAIGQLLKCCWALVPALEEATETSTLGGSHMRVVHGPGKRAETEAIARAVLGSERRRSWEGEGGARGLAKNGHGVSTREAEALVAVVEFLQRGGGMETVRLTPQSNQQSPDHLEADDDAQPLAPALPACHPGVVSPLAALGVVVTLAEALVDCLLSGLACPPEIPEASYLRSNPTRCAALQANASKAPHHGDTFSGGPVARNQEPHLVLWATADVFTLLTAATRAADCIAGPTGFCSKQHKEGLSGIVVSLPAETLDLYRGPELNSALGADEDSEDDGRGTTGKRGGRTGRGAGGRDATGPCALLSASSALVFTKEFLAWAATEKSRSPAALVAEGWDGGIGVWLGLVHSVQTLAKALRTARGTSGDGHRPGVSSKGNVTPDNGPSAEEIALAVFELRAVVGTPSAALAFLDPAAATTEGPHSSNEHLPGASSSSSVYGCTIAGNNANKGIHDADPSIVSRSPPRPPPGTMITGFLEGMSYRWKAALPWGMPGATAPTRASPRLEQRNYRRAGDNATGSMKAEAEDLFFSLQRELLRAEQLVLSILLVGPNATPAEQAWIMRAALVSTRRRRGEETVDRIGLEGSRPPSRTTAVAAPVRTIGTDEPLHVSPKWEDPPESGSGHARAAPQVNRSTERTAGRKVTVMTGGRSGGVEEELGPRLGGDKDVRGGGRSEFTEVAAVLENGEEVERGGLGSLCRLAAEEMREGLENGLSVQLSLVYLDLIELLGSAALQCRREPQRISTADVISLAEVRKSTVPRVTARNESQQTSADGCSTQSRYISKSGDQEADDAGGILLSIITCHTVSQHKIFQRLMRGAVRFDGIGVCHLHRPQESRTAAITLLELQARDQAFFSAVADLGSSRNGSGEKGMEALQATAQSPPPPLGRSSRLLVHCARWIRARQGNKRGRAAMTLFEEDGSESSEGADIGANGSGNGDGEYHDGYSNRDRDVSLPGGQEDDDDLHSKNGPQSRYSFRPEEVNFASSRECFVAVRVALLEYETALSSAGGTTTSSGGGLDVRGGGTNADGDLADVLAAVAFGLREFLAPKVVTMATTARTATQKAAMRKGKANPPGSAPASSPAADAASTVALATERSEYNKSNRTSNGVSAGGASPTAALDMLPETTKLLLMRVLERVCLVGKVATVTAMAALARPSSTAIATAAPVQASSSPPPPPPPTPPLPSSCPSSPPSKRRRQQCVTVTNAGKPGDQAGGAPTKAPTKARAKRGKTSTADCGGGGSWAAEENVAGSNLRSSQSKLPSPASASQGKGTTQGGGEAGADAAVAARSKLPTGGPETKMAKLPDGVVNPLLASVLPAVALASGDCLQLMLAARVWAEALRSKTRTGGDDPCRKRASVLLFKIERCELDIGAAAQKARQFVQHFEESAKNSTGTDETRGAGVGSARKRSLCVGNSVGRGSSSSSSSSSQAKAKHEAGTTNGCDETLETALRLLVSGADTLAAWRRDSAAREKSRAARRSRGGKKRGHTRQRPGVALANIEEEEMATERRGGSARDRFGGASGKRRKSRGARVRSRNVVIDGWLEEGGEEGGGREDAFVDLEDFIEAS